MTNPTDEELREWLAVCETRHQPYEGNYDDFRRCAEEHFPAVVRALLAAREAARWFDPVKEPPKVDGWYMTHDGRGNCGKGYYHVKLAWWERADDGTTYTPIGWQPLPPAPQ